MPDSRKKLIWMMILASIAVAGFIIYVLVSIPAVPKLARQEFMEPIAKPQSRSASPVLSSGRDDFITPAIEAFGETISSILEPQKTSPLEIRTMKQETDASSFEVQDSRLATVTISEKEVFRILYPSFVIDFFRAIQEELTKQGVVTTSNFNFDSEKDIKDFSLLLGKQLLAEGAISSANYKEFEKGVLFVFNMSFEEKRREAVELSKKLGPEWNLFSPPTTREAKEEFLRETKLVDILGAPTVYSMPAFQELSPSAPTSLKCSPSRLTKKESQVVLWTPILKTIKFLDSFYPFISTASAKCRGATYCIVPAVGYCWMEGAPLPGGSNIMGVPCCSGRICGVPIGCLELCGSGSKPFIWMPGICGCGGGGGGSTDNEPTTDEGGIGGSDVTDATLTDAQSEAFGQDSNITETGAAPGGGVKVTDEIGGVGFSGVSELGKPTVMFDNSMTQTERDTWMKENSGQLTKGPPDVVIYATKDANFDKIGSAYGANFTNYGGYAVGESIANPNHYPGDDDPFSGIVIRSSQDKTVLAHELGHITADQYFGKYGNNDPMLNNLFKAQQELVNEGGIKNAVTEYSATNVGEFTAEIVSIYNSGGATKINPGATATYNSAVDYLKSTGALK